MFISISDVHISLKNLDVSIECLRQWLTLARKEKLPAFCGGDLNDTKAILRSEYVKALIDLFVEFEDVNIIILIGNHDLNNKNSNDHSLEFLKPFKNITIIDRASSSSLIPTFKIIPYQVSNTKFLEEIEIARQEGFKRILCHQGFLGSYLGDYVVDESSVDPLLLADFEFVGSGHYHRSQRPTDNLLYWGSPFTVNFGEANEEKFIWKVEEINNKISTSPIMTNVRRHKQITFEDEIPSVVEKLPENSLVKVMLKGTKEFTQSVTVEYLKQLLGVQSVTIATDITKQSEKRVSSEILNNPIEVIKFYLENCKTTYSKEELQNYFNVAVGDLINNFSQSSSKQFRLKSAKWINFLSFKEESYEYSPMGLTLIEGYDEDLGVNTGSGKSSFLDVPCYGMYGETSKALKADEVINRQAGKNCSVELLLESQGEEYRIKRYRKHSEFENDLYMVLPSGQELRGKDNRETQKLIEQQLGKSLDIFLKSSYFTQFGAMDRFLSASDTEKKLLIAEITDLSIYDQILDRVKDQLKADTKILEDAETNLKQDAYKVSHLNETIKQNKALQTSYHINKDVEIFNLDAQAKREDETIEDEKATNHSNRIEWDGDLLNSRQELVSLEKSYETLRAEQIENLNIDLMIFNQNKQAKRDLTLQEIEGLEEKISPLTQKLETLKLTIPDMEALEVQRQELLKKKTTIEQLQLKSQKIQQEQFANNQTIKRLLSSIEEDKKKIKEESESECVHCYQSISAECIQRNIEVFQVDIDKTEDNNKALQKKIDDIKIYLDQLPIIETQLEDIRKKGYEKKNIELEIETAQRSITSVQETIKFKHEMITQIDLSVAPVLAQIESKKKEANPYTQKIADNKAKINPYLNYVPRTNEYRIKLEQKQKEVDPYIEIIANNEKALLEAEAEEYSSTETRDYWQFAVALGTWWKQALHVYIKSYLMDSCFEQINIIANEHLNTLFDGVLKLHISAVTEAKSETKEKISVQIINNGDECSYNSLSGGERARICLALNLSLAKVIARSSGTKLNWIALDEILNGLDEVGKSQTMKFLKELESEYETIFVIDHDESFKSMFTNSISIVKKSKISKIV